jgi:hypothetical protein
MIGVCFSVPSLAIGLLRNEIHRLQRWKICESCLEQIKPYITLTRLIQETGRSIQNPPLNAIRVLEDFTFIFGPKCTTHVCWAAE